MSTEDRIRAENREAKAWIAEDGKNRRRTFTEILTNPDWIEEWGKHKATKSLAEAWSQPVVGAAIHEASVKDAPPDAIEGRRILRADAVVVWRVKDVPLRGTVEVYEGPAIDLLARSPVDKNGRSALAAVVARLHREVPKEPERRYIVVTDSTEPMGRVAARTDAVFNAELQAVEVDAEPIATPSVIGDELRQRYHLVQPLKKHLLFPERIGRERTGDWILYSIAAMMMSGDQRTDKVWRTDAARLLSWAYASSGAMRFSNDSGSFLLSGKVSDDGYKRFEDARSVVNTLDLWNPRTGQRSMLCYVRIDGDTTIIGPASSWTGKEKMETH